MRGLDARRSEAALRRVACAVIGLVFPDRWVWDFWLVRDGADHHVFYLQAPSDSASPDGRHWHASIGHAVSSDLTNWQVLGDALRPGPPGSWDDASTWTGSVVPVDGGWAMLYTGISTAERGLVQRIELARSTDLLHWDKHGGPVLEADARWYELYDTADPAGSAAAVPRPWPDQAWRHPWVYPDGNGRWQAVLTARAGTGDPAERGVVGQARSADLLHWEVLPPLTPPRLGFGQMEVPQLLERGGRTYLIFCSDTETQAPDRRRTGAGTGTYYLVSDSAAGPFEVVGSGVLEADHRGSVYAGKLHETTQGGLVFLAWHRTRRDGAFHGALGDPRPVSVNPDGSLRLG